VRLFVRLARELADQLVELALVIVEVVNVTALAQTAHVNAVLNLSVYVTVILMIATV
jgi:hypothetical protein